MLDFVHNGQAHGDFATMFIESGGNPAFLRPIKGKHGNYFTVNDGGKERNIVTNAPALLTRDEWLQIDSEVQTAAYAEPRVFDDLRAAGLTYNIPDPMGVISIGHQTMGGITPATISMDGMRQSEEDRPEFGFAQIPVPIIHKDSSFSAREVAVSRRNGMGIDTVTLQESARVVRELIDGLTLGTLSSYSFAGGTIYGLRNHPNRILKTDITPPTGSWTPDVLVDEVIAMMELLWAANYSGPYRLYMSRDWLGKLAGDYSATYAGVTVRQRLAQLEGLTDVRVLPTFAGPYELILVQMTSNVIQAAVGTEIVTVQWSDNPMRMKWKVMAVQFPRIRAGVDSADASAGDAGIVHGTTS
jgi:hypothetical protein